MSWTVTDTVGGPTIVIPGGRTRLSWRVTSADRAGQVERHRLDLVKAVQRGGIAGHGDRHRIDGDAG